MNYITQNRFKSPLAWVSLISLITFILKNYYNVEIPNVDMLVDLILSVLTGFGILNNPTSKDNF